MLHRVARGLISLGSRLSIVSIIVTTVVVVSKSCEQEVNTGTGGSAGSAGSEGGTGGSAEGGSGGSTGGSDTGGSTGGSGGHTGGSGATTSSGGTGGCQPDPDPCGGAVCGTVDDGCGNDVECGTCSPGEPCVDGQCCAPKTCADYPEACGGAQRDNGCGGTIFCGDATCGDGSWMTCGMPEGLCRCEYAIDYPNADAAHATCMALNPNWFAFYCGEPPNLDGFPPQNPDAPPGCVALNEKNLQVPGEPRIWCCPAM